jgi:hypothetical protein
MAGIRPVGHPLFGEQTKRCCQIAEIGGRVIHGFGRPTTHFRPYAAHLRYKRPLTSDANEDTLPVIFTQWDLGDKHILLL